jgi:broad specificity phosphatase PhoE
MMTRLTMLCHASTPAVRAAAFPDDEALEEKGAAAATALAGRLAHADRVLVDASLRTRQTASALSLNASEEAALRDCDYGSWRGRTFVEVAAAEPEAIALWMSDPEAAPHGGESVAALIRRVGAWLDGGGLEGSILAITHTANVRAAVVHALGAPPTCFWRIDAAPLSVIDLRRNDRRWMLRAITL